LVDERLTEYQTIDPGGVFVESKCRMVAKANDSAIEDKRWIPVYKVKFKHM